MQGLQMDLIYPNATTRLCDSLNSPSAKSTMALEEESFQEDVPRLCKLFTDLNNNSTETQVENLMSSLADSFDDEVDAVMDALEEVHALSTVVSAMQHHFHNFKIQLRGCYVLLRLIEVSPKVKSELLGQSEAQRFILKVMAKYADRTCQALGCKIISALCTSAEARPDALLKGALASVLYAMSQFGEDDELYIPAFDALTRLLADDPKEQEKFMSMDVKNSRKNAYRMVVEIIEKYQKSGELLLSWKRLNNNNKQSLRLQEASLLVQTDGVNQSQCMSVALSVKSLTCSCN